MITINAHSSIRIEDENIVYVDPFQIVNETHDADIIFFTHSHFDHFNPESFYKLVKESTIFVGPETILDTMVEANIPKNKIITLNPYETVTINGIKVDTVPSYNLVIPNHKKELNWVGYILTINNKRIYIAGDTDLNDDIVKVKCDIALVPVGDTYTMNEKDAAKLVNTIKPQKAIPTHYGSLVGDADCGKRFKDLVDPEIEVEILI